MQVYQASCFCALPARKQMKVTTIPRDSPESSLALLVLAYSMRLRAPMCAVPSVWMFFPQIFAGLASSEH